MISEKDVEGILKKDENVKYIRQEVLNKFNEYSDTLRFMAADAPIQILCLPKKIEKVLLNSSLLRIYDLFDVDLIKIEGLDESGIRNLTTRLDQFFSVL
jgi:hypothetical protein